MNARGSLLQLKRGLGLSFFLLSWKKTKTDDICLEKSKKKEKKKTVLIMSRIVNSFLKKKKKKMKCISLFTKRIIFVLFI